MTPAAYDEDATPPAAAPSPPDATAAAPPAAVGDRAPSAAARPATPPPGPPLALTAYALGGPLPPIRPAPARRDWMDATPDGFANRCLPLTIANAHGWEILGGCAFEAYWTGGPAPHDVRIARRVGDEDKRPAPVAHFGSGVLTFHVEALFRTDPGVSLWVGGSPNLLRDGIGPLTGIVETDWSPASFTMNWRFTRPNHVVRFLPGEPVCFVFPVPRDLIARTVPRAAPLAADPDLAARHAAWRESRGAFNTALKEPGAPEREAGWQRGYHRGRIGEARAEHGHATRVSPRPFPPLEG